MSTGKKIQKLEIDEKMAHVFSNVLDNVLEHYLTGSPKDYLILYKDVV